LAYSGKTSWNRHSGVRQNHTGFKQLRSLDCVSTERISDLLKSGRRFLAVSYPAANSGPCRV
jgi:hypothetical protein